MFSSKFDILIPIFCIAGLIFIGYHAFAMPGPVTVIDLHTGVQYPEMQPIGVFGIYRDKTGDLYDFRGTLYKVKN